MLFLLPVGVVPLCVALGFVLCAAVDLVRGRVHGERALLEVFSAWHALGPAFVLALAGEPDPTWSVLPLLGARARSPSSRSTSPARPRAPGYAFGVPAREQLRRRRPSTSSTPRSPRPASSSPSSPTTSRTPLLLVLPLVGLLRLLRAGAARAGSTTRSSSATPTAARRFLLGDVIEADDAYTGSAQPRRRRAGRRSVRRARARREARSSDAELTALLHDVGKIRIPAEIINKPGKLTAEERGDHRRRTRSRASACSTQVGGLLGRVGHLVRSCHERWDGDGYPDGAGRRGDPARRPHRLRLRRLQRDDHRPPVPRGPLCRRGAGASWRSAPARSSTPTSWPRSPRSPAARRSRLLTAASPGRTPFRVNRRLIPRSRPPERGTGPLRRRGRTPISTRA